MLLRFFFYKATTSSNLACFVIVFCCRVFYVSVDVVVFVVVVFCVFEGEGGI